MKQQKENKWNEEKISPMNMKPDSGYPFGMQV